MEDILEHGGFQFKETVMSGDPLWEEGELRKVLGLRWDTERDKICVDVKLNFGEKVKGAYLEEDAPLSDPESALPSDNTQDIVEGGTEPVRPPRPPERVHGEVEVAHEKSHAERKGGRIGERAGQGGGRRI
jgi:hypothetical protein